MYTGKVTAKDDHTGSIPAAGATKVIMTRSIARVQLVSLKADFSALESDGKTIRFDVTSVFLANVRANASVMGEEIREPVSTEEPLNRLMNISF